MGKIWTFMPISDHARANSSNIDLASQVLAINSDKDNVMFTPWRVCLKAWEKLEEKLNMLLGSLVNFLKMFISKSTPASLKDSIHKPHFDFNSIQKKILNFKTKIDLIVGKVTGVISKFLLFFKKIDVKKLDWEKVLLTVLAIISPFLGRVRDWYISLKPVTMLAMVSVATMGGLSSIVIYQEVQKISDKSRDPASAVVVEVDNENTPSKRPEYYKQQERELRVRNISFPVYVGTRGPASVKKVVMDFTFVSSNRYIREYFFDNIHLLRDKLNTSLEQMLPEFPLEDDGKRVIKEKIQKEMQVLLNDLKIEGSIEKVYIHSIMAG